MAERRMFTKKITDDDHFLSLSASSQALYMHICMASDDDGFCNQISACMFKAHASTQDLESLITNKYLIQFENGVVVVKHWRMSNTLRKDRYNPTTFQAEYQQLKLKNNESYTLSEDGCQMVAKRLPNGCQMVATVQDSIVQDSIVQDSLVKTTTSIVDVLTDVEFLLLENKVENILELIEEVDRGNIADIKKPFNYCLAVAKERGMLK